jgi:hypothetical protein
VDISISGRFLKVSCLTEERYIDVEDPEAIINEVRSQKSKADIFTFFQRLPDSKPKFDYHMEFDEIAVLPIRSLEYWLLKQIPKQTRTSINAGTKKGVVVRLVDFDDEFIRGMTEIFNENPIRQGRPFWHYGKDFEAVKREFSKYAYREEHIGAYLGDELIGFIFLANADRFAITIQIISKIKHQDKKPTNLLLAKAVEMCAEKKIPYLVYGKWARGSWGKFKRNNGFEKVLLPRYYIPLTIKGKFALALHLHHGIRGLLPEKIILQLIALRKMFYTAKSNK